MSVKQLLKNGTKVKVSKFDPNNPTKIEFGEIAGIATENFITTYIIRFYGKPFAPFYDYDCAVIPEDWFIVIEESE